MGVISWHSYADCPHSSSRIHLRGAADHYCYGIEEVELPANGYNFVRCSARSGHTDGIVVAVHGACRLDKYSPAPSAAYGVYVSPGSEYTYAARLPAAPTSIADAELEAGVAGLLVATEVAYNGAHFRQCNTAVRQVVVKTDSALLAHTLVMLAGAVDSFGGDEAAGARDGYVGQLAQRLVYLRRMGIAVHVWLVKRENNFAAVELAMKELDKRPGEYQVGAIHGFASDCCTF